MFEKYIGGQEIQVAVINKNALGAIELVPKRSFYDYKAKYTKACLLYTSPSPRDS